ncbi:hypothetical protein VUR80DRAFT_1227 [Thermomyces stellatus]
MSRASHHRVLSAAKAGRRHFAAAGVEIHQLSRIQGRPSGDNWRFAIRSRSLTWVYDRPITDPNVIDVAETPQVVPLCAGGHPEVYGVPF